MRVIITGGTGLIGRAVSSNLLDDGHDVIVLSRNPDRAGRLPAGARAERWGGRALRVTALDSFDVADVACHCPHCEGERQCCPM